MPSDSTNQGLEPVQNNKSSGGPIASVSSKNNLPIPGDIFANRYRVEKNLGIGSLCSSFLCRDSQSGNREVVLKIMHARKAVDSIMVESFLFLAESVSKYQHKGIAKIFEVGKHQAAPYYVMEFVTGTPLRLWLMERLNFENRVLPGLGLVRSLLEIFETVQERGCYGCLKPENIFVTLNGPVIMDFGTVGFLSPQEFEFNSYARRYLPYMAPELRQDWSNLLPQSDYYSLGAILYEIMVGRPPAPQIRLPSELSHVFNIEADEIILKSMAINPQDRFATLQAFIYALESLQNSLLNVRPMDGLLQNNPVRQVTLDTANEETREATSTSNALSDSGSEPISESTRVMEEPSTKPNLAATTPPMQVSAQVFAPIQDEDTSEGFQVSATVEFVTPTLPLHSEPAPTAPLVHKQSLFEPPPAKDAAWLSEPVAPPSKAVDPFAGLTKPEHRVDFDEDTSEFGARSVFNQPAKNASEKLSQANEFPSMPALPEMKPKPEVKSTTEGTHAQSRFVNAVTHLPQAAPEFAETEVSSRDQVVASHFQSQTPTGNSAFSELTVGQSPDAEADAAWRESGPVLKSYVPKEKKKNNDPALDAAPVPAWLWAVLAIVGCGLLVASAYLGLRLSH